MKHTFLRILSALLVILCLSGSAMAASDNLVLITRGRGAILYNSYILEETRPIALIPFGKTAIRIADIDWGYWVAFGNYAGYISEEDGICVSSDWFEYELPCGKDYSFPPADSSGQDNPGGGQQENNGRNPREYVPEFPYQPIGCEPLEYQISTRSGPNTAYTWEGNHSARLSYRAFYQTEGNGINWAYVEFTKYDVKYRLYTGMWRLKPVQSVPYADEEEEYVWARITQEHTPHLGPGYDYAECEAWSAPGIVKAFYRENDWLMYERKLENGEIQRCWAPPECWE